MVSEIRSVTERFFWNSGPFFAFLPLTNQKIKILNKKKPAWGYNFTQVYQKVVKVSRNSIKVGKVW